MSQVINQTKTTTDSKSKLHSQSKEKQALNQTMYQAESSAYQLNQTLTAGIPNN